MDLQVPAMLAYLGRNGLKLAGSEVVGIGTWQGRASHPISVRHSPLQVRLATRSGRWSSSGGRKSAWPSGMTASELSA